MSVSKNTSPLKDKRILITRPQEQAQPFIDILRSYQAIPVVFPTIRIMPPRSWEELDRALARLYDYDTILFTSVNGVLYFFERLNQKNLDPSLLLKKVLVAIGPRTAAQLEHYGLSSIWFI